jgi:transglutaminase-like putative cysteine protease
MSFSRLHKIVAYLISGLGLFGLTLGEEITPVSTIAIALGYVASWFAEGPRIRTPGYGSGWTTAVVVGLLIQAIRAIVEAPSLALAIEFAAFLQISRLFTRRTAVDYQQIAVLAFVHLVAATVLSTSLSYGVMFIGFVVATPWMLALSHLRREIEGNYMPSSNASPEAQTGLARVLASRRVVGPRFLIGTAFLAVPLFAMTLSIFVVVPRVGKGFLSFQREGGQRVAGFGNQVELGGFGVIRDDPTVVVRVTPSVIDEKAQRLTLRLRGTSFDHYDGKRWTRTPSASERLRSPTQDMFRLSRDPEAGRDDAYQIVLEHLDEPVVFLPEGAVALQIPPRVERGERFARRLTSGAGLDLRYDADGVGLMYTAFVAPDAESQPVSSLVREAAAKYLQVPKGHERIAELTKQVIGDSTSDTQSAQRVMRWLNGGTFRYTLSQPNVGDKPPLEAFLFDAKAGHCEYFSSAMAIMLRTLGIPTRNVTGFVGGRFNPYGRYYALRQGDAHSWVEVYIRDKGWMTFDPTPPARSAVGPRVGLWSDVNAMIDAMRMRWMTTVIGYDLRTQVGMLRQIGRWIAAHQPSTSGLDDDDGQSSKDTLKTWLARAGRTLAVLVAILLAAAAYWLFQRKRARRGPVLKAEQAIVVRLYRDLERALRKHGQAREPSVTPLEHARLLAERGAPYSEDVALVTRRYMEARYGDRALSNAEVQALKDAVSRISATRVEHARKPPAARQ